MWVLFKVRVLAKGKCFIHKRLPKSEKAGELSGGLVRKTDRDKVNWLCPQGYGGSKAYPLFQVEKFFKFNYLENKSFEFAKVYATSCTKTGLSI